MNNQPQLIVPGFRPGHQPSFMKPKDRRLRMMWNSNAVFVPSGYGIEQRDMLFRFVQDGWTTAQVAFTGLEGGMIGINGLTIYPKMGDTWGVDAMVMHGKHFQANVVFSMQDVWTLNPQFLQQIPVWIPYVPIDQEPVPANVLNALRYAYKIVTFSKFGQKALLKAGFVSRLIVEGTDVNIFKPMDKALCRQMLNIPPDKFVFGMIGANKENPPRKGWQQALEAFKMFHDKHPEALFFYQSNQNYQGGFPIQPFAEHLGISQSVMKIDDYLGVFHSGSDVMAKMMNAFDVLLHPSMTEGFGLVVIEAQACGLPVIVNNCCSMPELIIPGVTGEICDTEEQRFFTNALGYYYFANVKSLYEKMEKLYIADRVAMGKAAREHVIANYNIDTLVKEQWNPFLEELQVELLGKPAPTIDKLVKPL